VGIIDVFKIEFNSTFFPYMMPYLKA